MTYKCPLIIQHRPPIRLNHILQHIRDRPNGVPSNLVSTSSRRKIPNLRVRTRLTQFAEPGSKGDRVKCPTFVECDATFVQAEHLEGISEELVVILFIRKGEPLVASE